ncbi:MAG: formylglycine-generating enzyme family protein [Thermoflexales bacterium]|nr:formylglycine-generating enzyme family protein [Thermoflexales bacterium]
MLGTGTYDTKATQQYEKDQLARRPTEKRGEPFYWNDVKSNNPLAPVVSVCWFEAEAYCNWLAHETGKPVRLPTEEEWERAARNTDGREYPWGNDFDRNRLNTAEFWSGKKDLDWEKWLLSDSYKSASTTMVGQFATGNSVAGISDLSGNVWEWTTMSEGKYRVLRGGSWYNALRDARCATFLRLVPDNFNYGFGFRVVVSLA